MKCLCCKKELGPICDFLNGGGELQLRFDYGSRYDQGLSFATPRNENILGDRIGSLLGCSKIMAYICDECFAANIDLFEGWAVEKSIQETKVIEQG